LSIDQLVPQTLVTAHQVIMSNQS